jgi:hypothetical protein
MILQQTSSLESTLPLRPQEPVPAVPLSVDADSRSKLTAEKVTFLRVAAKDMAPIAGLTHQFYRYPARFSPVFARAVIQLFSSPGDTVLDPYMGGGTTIVEAAVAGRKAIGNDLNELAVFLTRTKTTVLSPSQRAALSNWADDVVPCYGFGDPLDENAALCARRAVNLTLPIARPIKKYTALLLSQLARLPDDPARAFARCALLNAGQWALNGRSTTTPLTEFRQRVRNTIHEMLSAERELAAKFTGPEPVLYNANAADLPRLLPPNSVDLVVTSPPYPGIHVLYHRWQVDGRRESPAPYWIANCNDGQGTAYYNFAGRRDLDCDTYFAESLGTLRGIRAAMKQGAYFVQMVAFSQPWRQLRRYLANMEKAGFREVRPNEELHLGRHRRIWRPVPRRSWHATLKGETASAREVVLVHRCV